MKDESPNIRIMNYRIMRILLKL